MHFNGNRTLALGLTALLFAAVLSLSLSKDFYDSSMTNPIFPSRCLAR